MGERTGGDDAGLRVAIVGAGYIGNRHARVISDIAGLTVTVLVDPVRANAEAVAEVIAERGGPAPAIVSSLTEALAADEFDIALISTPSGLHAQLAVESISGGKHTLIEKPIEVSLAAAAAIAEAEAAHPEAIVSVISQHRFDKSTEVIRAAIADKRFGTITSGLAVLPWWRTQEYYDSGDWRGTWALDGGGSLMNQGVHNLDILVWLMGKPVSVYGQTALLAHQNVEVEDTAVATITFESGALATMLATTAAYPGLTPRIYVNGSQGSAMIDNDRLEYFHVAPQDAEVDRYGTNAAGNQADEARGGPEQVYADFETELEAGHRRQWDDYLAALRTGGRPGVTVADATVALVTIRAIYESARLGTPVLVEDVRAGKYESIEPKAPVTA